MGASRSRRCIDLQSRCRREFGGNASFRWPFETDVSFFRLTSRCDVRYIDDHAMSFGLEGQKPQPHHWWVLLAALVGGLLRERHNDDLPAGLIGDHKRPMLKTALVPMASAQHLLRNHFGVFPRLLIPGKFIAVRIGDRLPSAHDDIEKVSWHSGIISDQSKGCRTEAYRLGLSIALDFNRPDGRCINNCYDHHAVT